MKRSPGTIPLREALRFQLASIPGMGPVSLQRLEARFGSPERILAASESELRGVVRRDIAANLLEAARDIHIGREILEALESSGTHILYPDSPGVPSRLLRHTGEWHFLTHLGDPGLWDSPPVVGMVGRRRASNEGVDFAQELAAEFARRGVVTLSGMAQGIDRASHFGSLTANGLTVAVLPMGLLRFIKEITHWTAVRDAVEAGRLLLVSGAPPMQVWSVSEAMRRNQWIASWCDALVVIEAGDKGGTWKTASCAVRYERPLWVVSGFASSEAGTGNQEIISRLGARRLECRRPLPDLADEILKACIRLKKNGPSGKLFDL